MGEPHDAFLPRQLFLSELIGTGLLLLSGLSLVIAVNGVGSPVPQWVPNEAVRRSLTGLVFGSFGSLISVSAVGKVSGAHINPAVTCAFLLAGKLEPRAALGYVIAQLAGATLGCLPLLLWGAMGRSVSFGATLPGAGYSTATVVLGETIATFCLVSTLCVFLGIRRLRRFTPMIVPCLYAIMVPLEASISGTSTNPARSFGPALLSGRWDAWWIYWVGPLAGTSLAIFVFSFFGARIEVAKLYHFDDDETGVFGRMKRRIEARRRKATA